MNGWQWHQLDLMQIIRQLTPDRQPRQHLITQIFIGWMLFLTPNQQWQSTEGTADRQKKRQTKPTLADTQPCIASNCTVRKLWGITTLMTTSWRVLQSESQHKNSSTLPSAVGRWMKKGWGQWLWSVLCASSVPWHYWLSDRKDIRLTTARATYPRTTGGRNRREIC